MKNQPIAIKATKVFLVLFILITSVDYLAAQNFDSNIYYRLTSEWQGPGMSLDIVNDGKNNQPILAKTGNYTGQAWKITKIAGDKYVLSTKWQGAKKMLECSLESNSTRPLLSKKKTVGSIWKILALGNGYYRLINASINDSSLDIINDGKNNKIHVAKTGNFTGQSWKITPFDLGTSSSNNVLNSGESLNVGDKLMSKNGSYVLKMQKDGNLCVYAFSNGKEGRFVWGSMKYGFNNGKLTLQSDGNLVIYDGYKTAKWSSETHPHFNSKFRNPGYKPVKLVLEDNGKLNLYTSNGSVVWSSK